MSDRYAQPCEIHPSAGHEAACKMCSYRGVTWPTKELAQADACWHTYEGHPAIWFQIIGSDRPPRDPDPRRC